MDQVSFNKGPERRPYRKDIWINNRTMFAHRILHNMILSLTILSTCANAWACEKCTFDNHESMVECEICQTPNPWMVIESEDAFPYHYGAPREEASYLKQIFDYFGSLFKKDESAEVQPQSADIEAQSHHSEESHQEQQERLQRETQERERQQREREREQELQRREALRKRREREQERLAKAEGERRAREQKLIEEAETKEKAREEALVYKYTPGITEWVRKSGKMGFDRNNNLQDGDIRNLLTTMHTVYPIPENKKCHFKAEKFGVRIPRRFGSSSTHDNAVKRAYHQATRLVHPDRNPREADLDKHVKATLVFKELADAWERFKDTANRA